MTDAEIKKALKCCYIYDTACKECPFLGTPDCGKLPKNTISLINRQQAEIERLQTENRILSQKRVNLFERLEIIEKAKAEAIKEFAERLKKELINCPKIDIGGYTYFPIGFSCIDNLVTEMVGE